MNVALEIKVIHEPSAAEPFVVLSKPAGLASAPLKSLDEDSAFSQCARIFPAAKSVCGKKAVEGGLLHRIDSQSRILRPYNRRPRRGSFCNRLPRRMRR